MRLLLLFTLAFAACPPPTDPGTDPDSDPGTAPTDEPPSGFSDLERGSWTYVPVDGMQCGNGAPTGIGVNPGNDPERSVIVVQGGGACWDAATCYVLKAATHVETGWGAAQLQAEVRPLDQSPLFDRNKADNPWSDATWILLPYCTGDLHAGAKEARYDPFDPDRPLFHAGDANIAAALQTATGELPDLAQLWVIGFSAGGYGVQFQADRFVSAWPGAEVAPLADGAPMVHPYGGRWGVWRSAWDLRLPDDCADCATSMPAVLDAQATSHPQTRLGLITSRNDGIITVYANYPVGGLASAVDGLIAEHYVEDDQLGAFVIDGDEHVLSGNLDRLGPDGVRLGDWIEAWRDGSDSWTDVY